MTEKIVDVQYVNEKNGYYSFKAEDDSWYGCGDEEPRFKKGDKIKFEFTTNVKNNRTFNNVDMKTVRVNSGAGTVKPYKGSGGGKGNPAQAKYWDWRKEFDIQGREELRYAGARNAAIETMKLLAETGGLPVPKTSKGVAKALDGFLVALTEEYIGRLPNVDKPVAETKPEQTLPEVSGDVNDFSDLEKPDDFTDTQEDDDGFND